MSDDDTTFDGTDTDLITALTGSDHSRRDVLRNAATVGAGAVALSASDLGVDVAAAHDDASASVAFQNQETTGQSIVVDTVTLSEGGFVAIHDATLLEGAVVESVIGVSEFLEAGTHQNVVIDLFDVKGADFERDSLEETQPLVAMPHLDTNGNEEYDFVASGGEKDGPYTRSGQAVVDLAFVSIGGGTAVEFPNQSTDGSTVTVASVTVPDGGFVAIHDARLFAGSVIESVIGVSQYLEPGQHKDLTVELFAGVLGTSFDQSRLEQTQPLVAMPHLDTNGDQEYDFVATGGEVDGPYTRSGQAVVDLGFAVLE